MGALPVAFGDLSALRKLPLSASLKPRVSVSWKPVVKLSLWINLLNKLHLDKTLNFSKDHVTLVKPSDIAVLQVFRVPVPSRTYDPRAANSNKLVVDVPAVVTRSKLVNFDFYSKFSILFGMVYKKINYIRIRLTL